MLGEKKTKTTSMFKIKKLLAREENKAERAYLLRKQIKDNYYCSKLPIQVRTPEPTTFPPDIIKEIFHFLSVKELAVVARVCKKWREYTFDKKIWQDLLVRENNKDSLEQIQNSLPHATIESSDLRYWRFAFIVTTEFAWEPSDSFTKVNSDKTEFWNTGTQSDNPADDDIVWSRATSTRSWSTGKHTFRVRVICAKEYGNQCHNTRIGFCTESGKDIIKLAGNGQLNTGPGGPTDTKGTFKPSFRIGDLVECTIDFTPKNPLVTFRVDNKALNPKQISNSFEILERRPVRFKADLIRGGDRLRMESTEHEY